MWDRFTWVWSRFAGLEAIEGSKSSPSESTLNNRLPSGPDDWSSGKYERWLSGASSGSVGLGYDNRPGELILAYRNRHSSYAFA
ncbi:hypothetical protein PIB30_033422 [Stylosanthes scabra]|uniref:Uncharacterized protein n=1 Tax=Stylosanthes scabra TaxID=79078 RepID=A0ABU6SD37_9FABA|nr:hypothetical protein [Stylosanthes scabra]